MPVALEIHSNPINKMKERRWLHYNMPEHFGKFTLGEQEILIVMHEHNIVIGCHRVDVEALEKLLELHKCHFQKQERVVIQNGIE